MVEYLLSLFPLSPIHGSISDAASLNTIASTKSNTLLDVQNLSGNTPLHWAALNGHLAAVQILLRSGADASMMNKSGHDAVYEAEISGKEGSEAIVAVLLARQEGNTGRNELNKTGDVAEELEADMGELKVGHEKT